jgi:hypothetical protein
MELQHPSIQLLARINQYLGKQMVRRLRFVQTHAGRPLPGLSSALTRPRKLCLQKQSPICPKAGYGMRRMQ